MHPGNPDAPGQKKRRPPAPVDPTPARGETVTLRQDDTTIYADCAGFDNPNIHVQLNTEAVDPNPSTQGCAVTLYGTDPDGDGNLTVPFTKGTWIVPDLPRVAVATAWDENDDQKSVSPPLQLD